MLAHGFTGISQYVPVNPTGQIHIYWLPNKRHWPLFWQGDDPHGFTVIAQLVPVHPVGHKHW